VGCNGFIESGDLLDQGHAFSLQAADLIHSHLLGITHLLPGFTNGIRPALQRLVFRPKFSQLTPGSYHLFGWIYDSQLKSIATKLEGGPGPGHDQQQDHKQPL